MHEQAGFEPTHNHTAQDRCWILYWCRLPLTALPLSYCSHNPHFYLLIQLNMLENRESTPEQQAEIQQMIENYMRSQAQLEAKYQAMVEQEKSNYTSYPNCDFTPWWSENLKENIFIIIITIIVIKLLDYLKKNKPLKELHEDPIDEKN